MDKINAVLLTDAATANIFLKLYDRGKLHLEAQFTDGREFVSKGKALSQNCITVVDTVTLSQTDVNAAVSFLTDNKRKFIVIAASATAGFGFLSKGALEMLVRNEAHSDEEYISLLCLRIRSAEYKYQKDNTRTVKYKGSAISDKVILIGSSTGGAESIISFIKYLPENTPPIVIVQHMPSVFTKLYADRLDEICRINVWEAANGDELVPGLALIAPGDFQTRLVRKNDRLYAEVFKGEKVNGHAPSADVLFYSGAELLGRKALGIILTGMGQDGARGLTAMRKKGAFTIGQDEESCIVYGMPKAAYEMGGVSKQVALRDMAKAILENL